MYKMIERKELKIDLDLVSRSAQNNFPIRVSSAFLTEYNLSTDWRVSN